MQISGRLALQMKIRFWTPGCMRWNIMTVTPHPWQPTSLRPAFEVWDKRKENLPMGYQEIKSRVIFNIKLGENFHRKARLVGSGQKRPHLLWSHTNRKYQGTRSGLHLLLHHWTIWIYLHVTSRCLEYRSSCLRICFVTTRRYTRTLQLRSQYYARITTVLLTICVNTRS